MKSIAMIGVLLVMAGCSAAPEKTATGIRVQNARGASEVQEITLSDGTHCAVLIGYNKAGITCGWNK